LLAIKPVRRNIVMVNQERSVKNMFSYIEIINNKSEAVFNYVNFEITKNILSIKPVKGLLSATTIKIPLKEITDIHDGNYYGWNRIQFTYNDKKYIFIYSGYGEFDYLKENLLASIMA